VSASGWGSWGKLCSSTPFVKLIEREVAQPRRKSAHMIDKIEFPQRLKPDLLIAQCGPAEAAPLQTSAERSSLRSNCWSFLPLALAIVVLAVPFLLSHGLVAGLALQRAFSLVCHQRPERSFWILGAPVAVCARCLGIYLGAGLGLLLRTSRSIAMRLLVVAAFVNLLDTVTEAAGLHGNWMTARFVLGFALGAAAALLISSSMQASATLLSDQVPQRLDSTN
jgi:uncharacterized membrane protein